MKQHIRRTDLLWLFAYPLYQLIGTFRHEASHAVFAILEGAAIKEFVFWPTVTNAGFRWGYARWSGDVSWVTTAAPYVCDLATFFIFFLICTRMHFRHHWVWVNLAAIGLISPIVNSVYNYTKGIIGGGDVAGLFGVLPNHVIHSYFVITLLIYAVGLFLALRPEVNSTGKDSGCLKCRNLWEET